MIMLGCFSILSLEEHKKDFKLWVDENDFYNKDTTFAANWISQAHRNGFKNYRAINYRAIWFSQIQ